MEELREKLQCIADGCTRYDCDCPTKYECAQEVAKEAIQALAEMEAKIRQLRLALKIMNGEGIVVNDEQK